MIDLFLIQACKEYLYFKPKNKILFVGAIDFGTTFSGYAFMSKTEFESKSKKIEDKKWDFGRWKRSKTPTSVLFNENQEFHSFGYIAEKFYSDHVASKDIDMDKWYFFQNIKMDISEKVFYWVLADFIKQISNCIFMIPYLLMFRKPFYKALTKMTLNTSMFLWLNLYI